MYGYILVFFKFIYLVMENYEDDDAYQHQYSQHDNNNHSTSTTTTTKNVTDNKNENDVRNQFLNACSKGDLKLVQKLIDRGFRDEDNLGLSFAISSLNSKLISKLLNLKSYADPEFK